MNRTPTILAVLLAGFAAAWGCSQSPTGAGNASQNNRVAKLEKDLKAIEQERDAVKARVTAVEEKLKVELARIQGIESERDALRADLAARTADLAVRTTERDTVQTALKSKAAERDAVQAQFDGFKKNLKDLLGQMETTVAPAPVPAGNRTATSVLTGARGL